MSLSKFSDIARFLQELIGQELIAADHYINSHTIRLRVALRILKALKLDISSLYDLSQMIHVQYEWKERLKNMGVKDTEFITFQVFLSNDYHSVEELERIADMFTTNDNYTLNIIFAVDGLFGHDFKKYIKNLQYTSGFNDKTMTPDEMHARCIRNIYLRFPKISSEFIAKCLYQLYSSIVPHQSIFSTDKETHCTESLTIYDSKDVITFYEHNIGNAKIMDIMLVKFPTLGKCVQTTEISSIS